MDEPRDPFERSEFDRFLARPKLSAKGRLCFVQPVDLLGRDFVVVIALGARQRLDAGFGRQLGVSDTDVLCSSRLTC